MSQCLSDMQPTQQEGYKRIEDVGDVVKARQRLVERGMDDTVLGNIKSDLEKLTEEGTYARFMLACAHHLA